MGVFHFVGLAILRGKAMNAIEQAVTEAAEDLASKAQERAPVDTGTLRASIHVADVNRSAFSVTAKVATGGEANDYAVYQHEGTSRGVPATKFLEGPLAENMGVYREALARAVRGEF